MAFRNYNLLKKNLLEEHFILAVDLLNANVVPKSINRLISNSKNLNLHICRMELVKKITTIDNKQYFYFAYFKFLKIEGKRFMYISLEGQIKAKFAAKAFPEQNRRDVERLTNGIKFERENGLIEVFMPDQIILDIIPKKVNVSPKFKSKQAIIPKILDASYESNDTFEIGIDEFYSNIAYEMAEELIRLKSMKIDSQ